MPDFMGGGVGVTSIKKHLHPRICQLWSFSCEMLVLLYNGGSDTGNRMFVLRAELQHQQELPDISSNRSVCYLSRGMIVADIRYLLHHIKEVNGIGRLAI